LGLPRAISLLFDWTNQALVLDKLSSAGIWLLWERRDRPNDAAAVNAATEIPTAPIQLMDESDACSATIPPMPAPAAMANCKTEVFKLSIMPDASGARDIK
jgi:hypothetical protein